MGARRPWNILLGWARRDCTGARARENASAEVVADLQIRGAAEAAETVMELEASREVTAELLPRRIRPFRRGAVA